ncbi:MAG: chromate transporter [Solirubrobacteraceae bacterium]|nr:chromate transporter [Solirubrobacteraceae bacterium]
MADPPASPPAPGPPRAAPGLTTVGRAWGRIGCLGFGGPPAHVALLRELCVERRRWLDPREFEDAVAATGLLPGPASTQLAIFCAWRVRGAAGAAVGGLAFILPGLVLIVALAALFLSGSPPAWVRGAGSGAGAAVAAVALQAGSGLVPASWARAAAGSRARWALYLLAGGAAAATAGPWVVLVLLAAGSLEVALRRRPHPGRLAAMGWPVLLAAVPAVSGGIGALAWVALKVGALSYGGGFVIIPLMQADAVDHYHWMSAPRFLDAVALGQVTPGPVTHTVAVVGYAAAGLGGALLAAGVAFAPSFAYVLLGARHFGRLRAEPAVQAFLDGAGPAAVGAILGSAIPLALALQEAWQVAILVLAGAALLLARRGIVPVLLAAGAAGIVAALVGAPLPA